MVALKLERERERERDLLGTISSLKIYLEPSSALPFSISSDCYSARTFIRVEIMEKAKIERCNCHGDLAETASSDAEWRLVG